jgi:hypothetical protein
MGQVFQATVYLDIHRIGYEVDHGSYNGYGTYTADRPSSVRAVSVQV